MHDPGVEVWRDTNGEVAAYGGHAWDGHWLRVPGVAEFRIKPDDETVDASVEAGVSGGLVEDTFRRVVLPLALQVRGDEVLHASAALSAVGVVAFCGVSGTGKSTLAYALRTHGFRTFADDALVVHSSATGVNVAPLPFLLSLRDPAATFLSARPGLHEPGPLPESAPLLMLWVLERAPVETPSIVHLGAAEAFTAVLQHAYCFTLADRDRTHAMVDAYLNLVSRVPVLRLRFSPSLASLPSLVAEIENAVEQLSR
jgi:hypothetical protein